MNKLFHMFLNIIIAMSSAHFKIYSHSSFEPDVVSSVSVIPLQDRSNSVRFLSFFYVCSVRMSSVMLGYHNR